MIIIAQFLGSDEGCKWVSRESFQGRGIEHSTAGLGSKRRFDERVALNSGPAVAHRSSRICGVQFIWWMRRNPYLILVQSRTVRVAERKRPVRHWDLFGSDPRRVHQKDVGLKSRAEVPNGKKNESVTLAGYEPKDYFRLDLRSSFKISN